MIINYGGVKSDVNNKYDMWHKEILNKFGIKLKGTMREFYTEIQGARRRLEGLSIDASDDVTKSGCIETQQECEIELHFVSVV